jgi:hypothetical protein
MKAMFCFSNRMPRMMATMPRPMVAILETRISLVSRSPALLDHAGVEVVRDGRGAGQRQTGDHRQDGGEGHRRQEAEQHVAADRLGQVHGDHVAAADQLAADRAAFEELGVLADDEDGAEAHEEDHVEEVGDEAGGVEAPICGLPWRWSR